MLVNLKRKWFAPDGSRNSPDNNPHNFPDDWKDKLPSTAEIVEEEAPKAKPEKAEPEKKAEASGSLI